VARRHEAEELGTPAHLGLLQNTALSVRPARRSAHTRLHDTRLTIFVTLSLSVTFLNSAMHSDGAWCLHFLDIGTLYKTSFPPSPFERLERGATFSWHAITGALHRLVEILELFISTRALTPDVLLFPLLRIYFLSRERALCPRMRIP
jgi:hypothetical protein